MELFDKDGWPNFSHDNGILSTKAWAILIYGGRGTGKTYTMQKTMLDEDCDWLFLRRTNTQLKMIVADPVKTWPWAPINRDYHLNYLPFKVSGVNGLYQAGNATEQNKKTGKWICPDRCPVAISSVVDLASTNGFNNPTCKYIYLDEYQKTGDDYYREHEGSGLMHIRESINRNRGIFGEQEVKIVAASNACGMANPYFMELNVVDIVEKMVGKKQRWKYLEDRGILIVDLADSPIAAKKAQTAAYRGMKDTDYYRMAIENQYAEEEKSEIKSQNLKEYYPIVQAGRECIYLHKSKPVYYVTKHRQGSMPFYGPGDFDRKRFRRSYRDILVAYLERRIIFENYSDEIYFRSFT